MEEKKALKDLNLIDRFLFAEIMDNPESVQDALSIILGQDIRLIPPPQTEKEHRVSPLSKSIRMDVFSMSEEGIVYDMEAQNTYKGDLRKRSRYYQSLMDSSLLEPGTDNYNMLKDSYIIVITNYDIFGLGKYCYTFSPICHEAPELSLEDGAIRIFLNTRGKNEDEVSPELVEFLHYMENTTDKAAVEAGSDRIRRIHKRVRKAKKGEAIGMRFLQELEERNTARAEGRAEGRRAGYQDAVLELLSNFGELSEDLRKQILEQEDEEILKKWLLSAARAESVEDFMKKM